jgi:2'-5' RNA ligase
MIVRGYSARMGDVEAKSAIVIPFQEVDAVVDDWRRLLDPAQVRGIPAHVTVLFPFVHPAELSSDVLRALEGHFSEVSSFDVAFDSTGWFEDRVVYLEPKPERQFRTITKQLLQSFPSCVPYGGKFADPIPHLTIGDGAPLERLLAAEVAVRELFPITTRAKEAWLMTGGMGPNSWSLRQSFPFGNHTPASHVRGGD